MFENIFWILGGACSGKSTLAHALCEFSGLHLIDMDARIYGSWVPSYNAECCPENHRWIQQENALEWALGLSDEAYSDHCKKVSREYYQLLSIELGSRDNRKATIIDGGFSSLVPWVLDIQQDNVVCLTIERELAIAEWNSHPDRVGFKREIMTLRNGEQKWERFLELDALISSQLEQEAIALGIPVIFTRRADNLEALVEQLAARWHLEKYP